LETDPAAPALERRVAVAELVDGVRAPAKPQADELRSDDHQQRGAHQRVEVEAVPEERDVGEHARHEGDAERAEEHAGKEEEEVRVVDEHEAEVTPAVPEG